MSEGRSLMLIYGDVLYSIVYKPILESPLVMVWKRILHFNSHRPFAAGFAGTFAMRIETRIQKQGL